MTPEPTLSIRLLGPPQILRHGVPIDLSRRRSRALVYYLAAQAGPVPREQLLNLLWPDHERAAAQQILRTTLHGVRKAIGSALITPDDQIGLDQAVDVDVRTLVHVVNAPDVPAAVLTAAIDRYRDDFLAGFSLPDAEPFEEWMFAERERLRLVVVRGLTRMAYDHEERGDYVGALDALVRALNFDPLQEDLQRAAIRLHYLAGDRVAAIRRYEQLRDLLDAEMGVPPMAETRALYDAIITDSLVPTPALSKGRKLAPEAPGALRASFPGPRPDTLPFMGRTREIERLRAAALAGRLALIEGEPGIGKTRLAEEFLARHAGIALIGAARELEQALPYQPIVAALRGLVAHPDWCDELRPALALEPIWLREVARLLPELGVGADGAAPAGPPDEARLWEALARLMTAIARLRPLALLLDDLHWADTTTLGLVGYLLRRNEAAPISLLATARPAGPRAPLAALLNALTREGRLERLSLSRLGPADEFELAHQLSPLYAQPLADWFERNAEGNPYIIGELLRHARGSGLLLADGTLNLNALSAEPVVPQSVYSLIQSRLIPLSDAARRVLDAAVAAGREFEFEVAARAAALSEAAALDALDELRAGRIILPADRGQFRFDHSLTMEVAYREVGEPRHRLMHRRVAEALEILHRDRLDAEAGLIASHFAEGGAVERATAYAIRAGRQAARVAAWSEAIAFYEQALPGTNEAQRPGLLLALGDVLFQAGEMARAAERLREALDMARRPADANAARLALGRAMIPQGRYAEVIELVRPLAGSSNSDEQAAALFLWGTALSLEGADLPAAAEHLRAAERLFENRAEPDPAGLAQVRFELGGIHAQQGDLARAIAYFHEAMVVADSAVTNGVVEGAISWRVLARNNLAYHLHLLGDLSEAARYADEAFQIAEQRGIISLQPYLYSTRGEIALAQSELELAEQLFNSGLAQAERLNVPERIAGLTANLGLVALRRGQEALAIHRLSAALARADALGTRHLAAQIRIWLAPLLPPAEAQIVLREARAIAESGGRKHLLAQLGQIS